MYLDMHLHVWVWMFKLIKRTMVVWGINGDAFEIKQTETRGAMNTEEFSYLKMGTKKF